MNIHKEYETIWPQKTFNEKKVFFLAFLSCNMFVSRSLDIRFNFIPFFYCSLSKSQAHTHKLQFIGKILQHAEFLS